MGLTPQTELKLFPNKFIYFTIWFWAIQQDSEEISSEYKHKIINYKLTNKGKKHRINTLMKHTTILHPDLVS